jgi:hypothetical protein
LGATLHFTLNGILPLSFLGLEKDQEKWLSRILYGMVPGAWFLVSGSWFLSLQKSGAFCLRPHASSPPIQIRGKGAPKRGQKLFGEDQNLFGEDRKLFREDRKVVREDQKLFGEDQRYALFGVAPVWQLAPLSSGVGREEKENKFRRLGKKSD